MASSILIVEDEPSIAELISVNLSHEGFLPVRAFQADQAAMLMRDVLPDLIVLDWMLPGKSGIQFAKDLRNNERTKDIPIIFLTARSEEMDKIAGLDAGADDYITKPFEYEELFARMEAVLRRREAFESGEGARGDGRARGRELGPRRVLGGRAQRALVERRGCGQEEGFRDTRARPRAAEGHPHLA